MSEWEIARQIIGDIPDDYVDFVNIYGTGYIGKDGIRICSPCGRIGPFSIWPWYDSRLQFLNGHSFDIEQLQGLDFIRYGMGSDAEAFGWLTEGRANDWPTLLFAARGPDYEEFDMTFTNLLINLITGNMVSTVLPEGIYSEYVPGELIDYGPNVG